MDQITEQLAAFATKLDHDDISASAIVAMKRLLLDTLGCAVGGHRSAPAAVARRLAAQSNGEHLTARVFMPGLPSTIDAAAFANTVMVRYLDFNDGYISLEAAHPSDMIPALLAVAEAHQISGKDFLLATVIAYEVFAALSDAASLWDKGWDHGLYIALGTAAGVGRMLGLDRSQMATAMALSSIPSMPLRLTRSGQLTMWKGCATAHSNRAALYGVALAKEGMTAPTAIFEGRHGIWDQVTGPFKLGPLGKDNENYGCERIGIKYFPTEGHSQLPLWLALNMRSKFQLENVESIHVTTYHFTYSEIGSEPQKWAPTTRETADHSLPYMLAVALKDGGISVASFDEARIKDPSLPSLMKRITISESKEFTEMYPSFMPCKIEVVTNSGERIIATGSYPKGHRNNPMTNEEVRKKFHDLCQSELSASRIKQIEDAVFNIEKIENTRTLVDFMC